MSQVLLKTGQTARTRTPLFLRVSPVESARWAWLAVLAAAPWVYGCVLPWTWPWFSSALLATVCLWISGLLMRRRRPVLAWPMLALTCFLLDQGWLVAVNAGFRYDRERYEFLAIKPLIASWLPQAIDDADALPAMLRFTGLLGILLLAADASQNPVWRKRLFWTLTGNGTLLAAYGLAQRSLPDALTFWQRQDMGHSLFATYFYHGNAGAYLNLVLPFAFGAAIYAFIGNKSPKQKAFGAIALFLNLAGAVAIASKAAQCVTLTLLTALVFVYRREIGWRKNQAAGSRGRWAAVILTGAASAAVLAFASDRTVERWSFLPKILNQDNARLLADQACLRMLPDAGWWGIGPGNFAIAFPHYTNGMPFALLGRWTYAHEDYLQTAIEWGWIGAATWATLVFGALWQGRWAGSTTVAVARGVSAPSLNAILQRSAWLAVGGVLLHATVDFPLQIGSMQVFVLTLVGLLWGQPLIPGTKKAAFVGKSPFV